MLAPTYTSLSDLVNSVDFPTGVSPSWDYNVSPTKETAIFYEQWSNYLSTIPQAFTYFLNLPGWITKALYSINYALENVYNNLFKLFGFFDYLDNQKTFVGQIFDGLQKLGTAVFVLLLVMFVCASFVTGLMKYKDVISHFLLVTAVLFLLPQAIKQFSSVLLTNQKTIRELPDEKGQTTVSSLSIQPFKNNVVDLYVVIQNNFDVNKLGMDDKGFLNPANTAGEGDKKIQLNSMADDTVMKTDFGAWYGGTDKNVLEQFENDSGSNSNLKGVAPILSSVLRSSEEGNVRIDAVKPGMWSDLENVFSSVYPRYSVNWIGLIVQQIILIALLVTMSIKFVQSVFQVIVAGMIAPIVGYSSVESSEKFKELLQTIFGTITGLYFQVILLRVAMSILRDFPGIVASGLDGTGFTSGLNYWENIMASIIVYAGVYFAVSSGNSAVERWLGVGSSDNGGGSRLAGMATGGMAAGAAMSRSAGKMAKSAPRVARGAAKGVKASARGAGAAAKGAGSAAKGLGRGALKAAGAVHGTVDGVRAAGVGGAAANVASRAASSASQTVGRAAEGIKTTAQSAGKAVKANYDTAKSHYDTGRSAVANTLSSGPGAENSGNAGTKNEASGVGNTANQAQNTSQQGQGIGGASGKQIGKASSSSNPSSSGSNSGSGINKKGSGKT